MVSIRQTINRAAAIMLRPWFMVGKADVSQGKTTRRTSIIM